jgi:hypothetical protein
MGISESPQLSHRKPHVLPMAQALQACPCPSDPCFPNLSPFLFLSLTSCPITAATLDAFEFLQPIELTYASDRPVTWNVFLQTFAWLPLMWLSGKPAQLSGRPDSGIGIGSPGFSP